MDLKQHFKKIVILSFIVTTILLSYFIISFISFTNTPLNITEATIYEIQPGSSAKKIAYHLEKKNIIKEPIYFFLLAKLSGKDKKIHTGEYLINNDITPKQLFNNFINGKVIQYPFTIVEGWNIYQLIEAINNTPKLKKEINNLDLDSIKNKLAIEFSNPEGVFSPDTYYYSATNYESEILEQSFNRQIKLLENLWGQQNASSKEVINTPYQALILASIIEKETSIKEEMPLVAGVYINRLKKGMRLQADPTVIYGLGPKFSEKLSRKELKTDTPYNTYTRKNLPPTPICMPSKEAILAAIQPAQTDFYYFVANGYGGHSFSKTLEEHNKSVLDFKNKTKN